MTGTSKTTEKINVIRGGTDGLYFLVTDDGEQRICGTLIDQGKGIWRGVLKGGSVKLFAVEPTTSEPWRDAAERLTRR